MRALRSFPLARLAGDPPYLPPDQALRRLQRGRRPLLLDGSCSADGLGRYSYAACDPLAQFVLPAVPDCADLIDPPVAARYLFGESQAGARVQAPAAAVWQTLQSTIEAWHPLIGIGLLDYELGRASERLPSHAAATELPTAAIDFAAYEALYRYDAELDTADLLAVDADAAERLRCYLRTPPPLLTPLSCGPLRSDTSRAEHARAVATILDHLAAGDCYQVNLCRTLRAQLPPASVLPAYLRLRRSAPAPLAVFLRLDAPGAGGEDAATLLSNTPELFLNIDWQEPRIETRPIKGTRPRGLDAQSDQRLRDELQASRKDLAEHVMIVDLLRNDLGRIARPGSVAVDGFLRCVSLPTVHHLISTVSATPAPGIGLAQLLHATFPGGSITGAPKVAAMQLIDALEPRRRGPFYGAVGWLSREGGTLALCIRTAVASRGELVLAVGGGIVLDSTAADEWAETEAKAAAFARVLGSAT
jgi:para-aminobenzoate synthetase component 1